MTTLSTARDGRRYELRDAAEFIGTWSVRTDSISLPKATVGAARPSRAGDVGAMFLMAILVAAIVAGIVLLPGLLLR